MSPIEFQHGNQTLVTAPKDLVIAGWTGRDAAAVERHIAELEAISIPRPRKTPMFYRVGANLLTTEAYVDVVGPDSSGEVEFVLISTTHGIYVGVGSDHTDRKVESYKVTVSKQMCPKPIARTIWPMREVQDHWDSLILRSWMTCNGKRELYQEGHVAQMLSPENLVSRYLGRNGVLPAGTVMYCGTLPVLGGIRAGEKFEMELEDPKRKRSLEHTYEIRSLAYAD